MMRWAIRYGRRAGCAELEDGGDGRCRAFGTADFGYKTNRGRWHFDLSCLLSSSSRFLPFSGRGPSPLPFQSASPTHLPIRRPPLPRRRQRPPAFVAQQLAHPTRRRTILARRSRPPSIFNYIVSPTFLSRLRAPRPQPVLGCLPIYAYTFSASPHRLLARRLEHG